MDVCDIPTREPRRRERDLVDRWERVPERRRAREHRELRARESSGTGEARLVVHREPLKHPRGRVKVWERRRGAPEHALRQPPPAACAVEMKDVRQFVRHEDLVPVHVVAQRHLLHRRPRVDDDAVRRERGRVPVREVHVVGEHDVDDPARRPQFLRELAIRPLGVCGGAARQRLEFAREVHAEVVRAQRPPVEIGANLGMERERPQQRADERNDQKRGESQGQSQGQSYGQSHGKQSSVCDRWNGNSDDLPYIRGIPFPTSL